MQAPEAVDHAWTRPFRELRTLSQSPDAVAEHMPKRFQIECRKTYQIEYQLNCMTNKVQDTRISCHYRLGTKMLDRMTAKMPHRMTGYVSDKASDKMSE